MPGMQGVGLSPQSPSVATPRPQQEGVQDAQLMPTPGRAGTFQVLSICRITFACCMCRLWSPNWASLS